MTFKIGDAVIMTADSGKGDVFEGYEEREYRGNIFLIDKVPRLIVQIEDEKCTHYFNTDGSNDDYPGMSIRPAEEKVAPTPSQWIEGKAPPVGERELAIYIAAHNWSYPHYKDKNEAIHKDNTYTHWQYVTLPPPPPVKEVEAYGILEYINKYTIEGESIERARAFYSQPATAKVLGEYFNADNLDKYFNIEHNFLNTAFSIDQFINWYRAEYEAILFFTPAALDELGIK